MTNIYEIIKNFAFVKFIYINLIVFISATLEIIGIAMLIPILSIIQNENNLPKIFLVILDFLDKVNIKPNILNLVMLISVFLF